MKKHYPHLLSALLLAASSSYGQTVDPAWRYTLPSGPNLLEYKSQEEMEAAMSFAPGGGNHEVAFPIINQTTSSTAVTLDYRVAATLSIGAALPPAEYGPSAYSVWNSTSGAVTGVTGCNSLVYPSFCDSPQALANQITANYTTSNTCVVSPATVSGSESDLPTRFDSTLIGDRGRFIGGYVDNGNLPSATHRVQLQVRFAACGQNATINTLTWNIVKRNGFVCPENFRLATNAQLDLNESSLDARTRKLCVATAGGRGLQIGTAAIENKETKDSSAALRAPIPGPLSDKLLPDAPPRGGGGCPAGNPCIPSSGAKKQTFDDFSYSDIRFQRHYNSARESVSYGNLSSGWSHTFSARVYTTHLTANHGGSSSSRVYYINEKGDFDIFAGFGTRLYSTNNSNESFAVSSDPLATYTLYKTDGTRVVFNQDGYPVAYQYPQQPSKNLAITWLQTNAIDPSNDSVVEYLTRRVHTVTDARGRGLRFQYSAAGTPRLVKVRSLDNQVLVSYKYFQSPFSSGNTVGNDTHAWGNLTAVQLPNFEEKYFYRVDFAGGGVKSTALLTTIRQIYDGRSIDFGKYQYDDYSRVISSERAGGAGRITVAYQPNRSFATVTTPLLATKQFNFGNDIFRSDTGTSETSPGLPNKVSTVEYSANSRRITRHTVRLNATTNSVTEYQYADWQQPSTIFEARGTMQERKTDTQWNYALNLPTKRTRSRCDRSNVNQACTWVAEQIQMWELDPASGRTLAYCIMDPQNPAHAAYSCASTGVAPAGVRRTVNSYCASIAPGCPIVGLLTSIDGPRTDVSDITRYSYRDSDAIDQSYKKGDLWVTTNALGQTTENIAHDAAGRVTKVKELNGSFSEMTYHPRGWLTSRTAVWQGSRATTTISYTAFGAVASITQVDGAMTSYQYDDAQRLIGMSDRLGNSISYTLDAAGNRTAEVTKDANNAIRRSLARQYNQLSQLRTHLRAGVSTRDPDSKKTTFQYDAAGNRHRTTNPNVDVQQGTVTEQAFDALNRLMSSVQDLGGINARTEYTRDALDRVTQVRDPKGLITTNVYDGIGNQAQLISPDTGLSSFVHDAAGNTTSTTDARGVRTQRQFDALNRLIKIEYFAANGALQSAQTTQRLYDLPDSTTGCSGSWSTGRLSRFTDETGSTTYCYDWRGNVTQKTQVTNQRVLTTYMSYTLANTVSEIQYPTATLVQYYRDSMGRIVYASVNGDDFVVNVNYLPFGPVTRIEFANGKTLNKTYDQNYDIDTVMSTMISGLNLDYSTDEVGNIKQLNQAGTVFDLSYDKLYRLTEVRSAGQVIEAFSYDATGNRLSKQTPSGLLNYSYAANSHRLDAVGNSGRNYDAVGNSLTTFPGTSLSYDARNRLRSLNTSTGSVGSSYNGIGERVTRSVYSTGVTEKALGVCPFGSDQSVYVYASAGILLGNYNACGGSNEEFVYLGQLPIGRVVAGEVRVIETDHLGTPRRVHNTGGSVAQWSWDLLTNNALGSNAFGDQAPVSKNLTMSLRFPGQYADGNGLHYNYFRDYEPSTGRYVESDPIGLNGGISTYGYVGSRPLADHDAMGLEKGRAQSKRDRAVKRALDSGNPGYDGADQMGIGPLITDDPLTTTCSYLEISDLNLLYGGSTCYMRPRCMLWKCCHPLATPGPFSCAPDGSNRADPCYYEGPKAPPPKGVIMTSSEPPEKKDECICQEWGTYDVRLGY
jgi:RHS repeat-associated protein